jgi:diaminohydroxyphosphoribosylaminopyrimidine deaminase / 5-amino-6-(5-phosphoribosylamino)uracil reductase
MTTDEQYMFRCIELAKKASGLVAPNPMVGAVLVYQDRIIGEGYHQVYGGPHAEVNCLNAVAESDKQYITLSVLYVSLEPCLHHGKTPPCADMIIRERIPAVVIGCRDPFPLVDGKGIEKLEQAGVSVKSGVLEKESMELNKRFFTFHQLHRPYIILKWAQTADGMIAGAEKKREQISSAFSNLLVHQWRSEEASIMIGRETAITDNPRLTSRISGGKSPIRLVIDRSLKLPGTLHLFDGSTKTIIFNTIKEADVGGVHYCLLDDQQDLLPGVLQKLYVLKIQSILVEGGSILLHAFIRSGFWDEIRRLTQTALNLPAGYKAPDLPEAHLIDTIKIDTDRIDYFVQPLS